MTMDIPKLIQVLREQASAIDQMKSLSAEEPEFKKWCRNTRVVIERAFGKEASQVLEFQNISFFCGVAYPGMPDNVEEQAFASGLRSAKALLESMIQELQEYGPHSEPLLPGQKSKSLEDSPKDLAKVSIGRLILMLRPGQAWAVGVAIVTVLVGAFWLGRDTGTISQGDGKIPTETRDKASGVPGIVAQPTYGAAEDMLILFGSGTVHNFLREFTPGLFEDSMGTAVRVLEGATETGIRVISEAYLHGRVQRQPLLLLAMASRRQEVNNFILLQNDVFFEVQVGIDTLKATFGAPTVKSFEERWGGILKTKRTDMIDVRDLERWVWATPCTEWRTTRAAIPYRVYVTNPGSATRSLFEEGFGKDGCWPKDAKEFDLSVIRLMESNQPWVALGSRLLNRTRLRELQANDLARQLIVLGQDGGALQRGLFIYGRLMESSQRGSGDFSPPNAYVFDDRVAEFLIRLFKELEKTPLGSGVDLELLKSQKQYFHLESGRGWVRKKTGGPPQIYGIQD